MLRFLQAHLKTDLLEFTAHGRTWLLVQPVAINPDGKGVLVLAVEQQQPIPAPIHLVFLQFQAGLPSLPDDLRQVIEEQVAGQNNKAPKGKSRKKGKEK